MSHCKHFCKLTIYLIKIAGSGVEGEITAQSSNSSPTSVTPVNTTSTPTKEKIGGEYLSPNLNTKNASLVDQNDFDTSNGWENEDNLAIVNNPTKKVNNDLSK